MSGLDPSSWVGFTSAGSLQQRRERPMLLCDVPMPECGTVRVEARKRRPSLRPFAKHSRGLGHDR